MNYSRLSYSGPPDSACGMLLDLRGCEFCERTFLAAPLLKHKKICYREFLKKKTMVSREKSMSNCKPSSAKDLLGRSMSDIMVERRIRRMQWRERHEHFIQIIRSARDNSVISTNGTNISASSNTIDDKEDLRQCKHCLRNFHKDSIFKHSALCKEHSIQSNRFVPNDAHTEAKRRMSLRLYYKPKSFKGDCGEIQSSATSPSATECSSMASLTSLKMNTADISEVSSMKYSLESRTRTLSVSSCRLSQSNIQGHRNHQTEDHGKSKIKPSERNLQNSLEVKKMNQRHSSRKRNESDGSKKISESENNKKFSDSQKDMECRHKNMAQKLKIISNMLKSNSKDLDTKSQENKHGIEVPNSANSFLKAKEILAYLQIKAEENNVTKESCDTQNDCSSNKGNVDQEVELKVDNVTKLQNNDIFPENNNHCFHPTKNIEGCDLVSLLENIKEKLSHRTNVKLEEFTNSSKVRQVTTRGYRLSHHCTELQYEKDDDLGDLLSNMQTSTQKDSQI